MNRLATIREVAAMKGVTVRTVYYWVANEYVTAYKIGGKLHIDLDSLEKQFEPKLVAVRTDDVETATRAPVAYGPDTNHVPARFLTGLLPINHAELVRLIMSREVDGYRGVSDHYVNLLSLREWWNVNR
ncbi:MULTISPECIES: helix-turn-helix domain-containing protein [unclassified Rhodococcus (in: high G+C Gram-positive bacteria)]|uniref:helix-turn-helix domain-containing protein n=1 Tax=unclassified Rhodococcus (in: high G+C Gram-positive bacteria) TaxID=192944 RepID=UPI0016396D0D|nr:MULTISPECIES: helix-turn-helix domain-containing protein [unclassified Rhodococcus (in: high G+C Gram-positive bacteria)]MBC2639664.1 helix-turn-helix domain-containing protein [Rhodococcus sp. 3A]MBC2895591.1 helix-turn-helix domain-containing protein [Rhodococcus sp. 4CII]